MAIETHAHDGTAWRKAKQIYGYDGSAWRQAKKIYAHDGTAWRLVFSSAGWWEFVIDAVPGSAGLPSGITIHDAAFSNGYPIVVVTRTAAPYYTAVYGWGGSSWTQIGSDIPYVGANNKTWLVKHLSSDYHLVVTDSGKSIFYWDGSAWTLWAPALPYALETKNAITSNGSAVSVAFNNGLTTGTAVRNANFGAGAWSTIGSLDAAQSVAFNSAGTTLYAIAGPYLGTYDLKHWTGTTWATDVANASLSAFLPTKIAGCPATGIWYCKGDQYFYSLSGSPTFDTGIDTPSLFPDAPACVANGKLVLPYTRISPSTTYGAARFGSTDWVLLPDNPNGVFRALDYNGTTLYGWNDGPNRGSTLRFYKWTGELL